MKAVLYFDGGARPRNPGYSACAFVLSISDEDADREPIEFSRYLGIGTNNAAEYAGLIVGLKHAKQEGVTNIDIYTDSQLIEGHLTKRWTVGPELAGKVFMVVELLKEFEDWKIAWVKRAGNYKADALCTAAINWGRNRNPWTRKLKKPLEPSFVKDPYM